MWRLASRVKIALNQFEVLSGQETVYIIFIRTIYCDNPTSGQIFWRGPYCTIVTLKRNQVISDQNPASKKRI